MTRSEETAESLGAQSMADMTKREYIAVQIMSGLWAHEGDKDHSYEGAAQTAVEQADALLAELAK